jgi:ABC-type sulfate/molybdate transport systems ATPase subunit
MDDLRLDIAVPRRGFDVELTLEVAAGEVVALVGPSGSGKSTVLRAVAGLERPARGRIECTETWFDAERGIDVAAERRSVGLLFQEYALFPHLSVAKNVEFGGAAGGLLERLGIAHLAAAKPSRLSGGERQRVALARALARRPRVLLLDEPMSALDPHTRAEVRSQLGAVLRESMLPALIVTHDFEDAATLATRVGVLVQGSLRQLAAPADLVAAPTDDFVARLAGGNVLRGDAERVDGLTRIALESGAEVFAADPAEGVVSVLVYPWDVSVAFAEPDDSSLNHLRGPIESIVPLGNRVRVRIRGLTAEVTSASAERLRLEVGREAVASFKATATRVLGAS